MASATCALFKGKTAMFFSGASAVAARAFGRGADLALLNLRGGSSGTTAAKGSPTAVAAIALAGILASSGGVPGLVFAGGQEDLLVVPGRPSFGFAPKERASFSTASLEHGATELTFAFANAPPASREETGVLLRVGEEEPPAAAGVSVTAAVSAAVPATVSEAVAAFVPGSVPGSVPDAVPAAGGGPVPTVGELVFEPRRGPSLEHNRNLTALVRRPRFGFGSVWLVFEQRQGQRLTCSPSKTSGKACCIRAMPMHQGCCNQGASGQQSWRYRGILEQRQLRRRARWRR